MIFRQPGRQPPHCPDPKCKYHNGSTKTWCYKRKGWYTRLARVTGVSPTTIDRHIARLGRHCILYHAMMMQDTIASSTIVIDGFETFELSQYSGLTKGRTEITIRSDEHQSYKSAMKEIDCAIRHKMTSSKDHRDKRNPLWEVNLLDLLIRHGTAAHKRETVAWAKRRQALAERLCILQVWRNVIKRRWENGPPKSPAMLKGLTDRLFPV